MNPRPGAGPCKAYTDTSAIPDLATVVGLAHDHPGTYEGWYEFTDSGPVNDIKTLSTGGYYGFLATEPAGRVLMFDPNKYANWMAPGAPSPVCYLKGPGMGVVPCH
jgi:hypothetical protein